MRPRHRVRLIAVGAIVLLTLGLAAPVGAFAKDGSSAPSAPAAGSADDLHNSWIVTLRPRADAATDARGLARAVGGHVGFVYEHALNGFQLKGSAAAAAALRRDPRVKSIEADRPIFLTETLPYGVERIDAYSFSGPGAYQSGYKGTGARIAILDTGIDLDHPDLAASIDLASGLNCLNESLPPNDGYGHGTHVSGTAAAPLNGIGVVGVAPEAQLIPIKMFDDAGGSSVALSLCALERVVALNTDADTANDVDVANMSWGEHRTWGSCASDALHGAICNAQAAGVVLVAGAGNDARDGGDFVPAAYPEVISVSAYTDFDGKPGKLGNCQFVPSLFAIECDDTLAFFTDFGPSVDVTAPGVNVNSTWAGGGYLTIDGTSMATPHVSGVVALMRAVNPQLTPTDALAVLRTTGECPNGAFADADGVSGCAGQGTWTDDPDGIPEPLVNAFRAADAAAGAPPPPPPPPPPTPTAPAAPVLISAIGGASSITLNWTTPADGGSPITGYKVRRGTTSGGETLLATVGVQNSYVDSAVTTGTTYWYEVRAVNAIGTGPSSNELSAALVQPPSAPTLLGAPADQAVALSWTVPADDGGGAISGYNLYRTVAGGSESFLASTGATETVYVDFAVTNGTQYTYRTAAVNAAGEGALSNAVSVTPGPTQQITAPDPPQSVTARQKQRTAPVVVKWVAPAADGGSPIASYFVYRRGPGETSFTLIGVTATLKYSDADIARRETYTYYVTAFNSYFESAHSNQVSIKTR